MIKEFKMKGVHDKWLALMNHIRHSAPAVWQFDFPDSKAAKNAAKRLGMVIEKNPTWFHVKIMNRGCTVWVIKEDHIQKAVIKDE